MADVARCLCPHGSDGKKCGRNLACPFHGNCSKDPKDDFPYVLTYQDKAALRRLRIDPEDGDAIQQIRQADEDRFRP